MSDSPVTARPESAPASVRPLATARPRSAVTRSAVRRLTVVGALALGLAVAWPAVLPGSWLDLAPGDAPLGVGADDSAAWIAPAQAQRRNRRNRRRNRPAAKKPDPDKVFDFTGLDISGQMRAPQLLYFLDRASEELERASLERRSFLPEMVRSIDEESL
ncbi:hypothetical protein [Haliangium sp.]|uniref:hypothetical protein n=1 Tax=Haliangium sp. TaxID=2663208 RepID=UPI003D129EA2